MIKDIVTDNDDTKVEDDACVCEPEINNLDNKNPIVGEPGSELTCQNNKGKKKQTRRYASDGYPEIDTDWDHSHGGLGKPHSHDWTRPPGWKPGDELDHTNRGEGRPSKPGDPGFK